MEAQKIIITGGATRIGAAIAESLSGFNKEIVIQFNKSKKVERDENGLIKGQIDTASFARGLYVLKIKQGNTSTQKKIILK